MHRAITTPPVVEPKPIPHGPNERGSKLTRGAIGLVYGDIGTSPLYAMKESFLGPTTVAIDRRHVFGVPSLIFWSLLLVVTMTYVLVAMRGDNRGEGGSFALPSLISRNLDGKRPGEGPVVMGALSTTPVVSILLLFLLQTVAPTGRASRII